MKLRQGRKVPRNLYIQVGDEPSDNDMDVGRVDSEELAEFLCTAVNSFVAQAGPWGANELVRVAHTIYD